MNWRREIHRIMVLLAIGGFLWALIDMVELIYQTF